MKLLDFFYIKHLLKNRKKSEQERAEDFDKKNCVIIKLESKKNDEKPE